MTGKFDRDAYASKMRSGGWWADRTIDSAFVETARTHWTKDAVVGYRADQPPGTPASRLTYATLSKYVSRAAGALRGLGVEPGDVIALQLPNWWEFAVVALAAGRIGAVVNPLMPIFRERELKFMLAFADAKVLVVPKVFRGFDHEAMAESLRPALPNLRHVIVAGGTGENEFSKLLLSGNANDVEPPTTPAAAAMTADDVCVLMFTSVSYTHLTLPTKRIV